MREIFKGWLGEFRKDAYFVLYCMGEDGDAPCPIKGDRFFLLEKSEGDTEDKIIMWSEREEEFCYWNGDGSWINMKLEDVPTEVIKLNETTYPR